MGSRDPIIDVGSAAEAVSSFGAEGGGAPSSEATETPLHVIESLCMRCGENGTTRLLLTRIPHFREIILMAFECPHCNERNNEVQFAGQLQPQGCCYKLEVQSGDPKVDFDVLNRQVLKSDSATIKIPELDFEIPQEAQRGTLSTVEGTLLRAAEELQALQEERKKLDPKTAEAIDQFLIKLKSCASGDMSFTFILDDPAGNSFVENPFAPSSDPSLVLKFYDRTPEQQESLGFLVDPSSVEGQRGTGDEEAYREGRANALDGSGRPHGSVGAVAGSRAIAQGNTEEVAAALCRYSAPEEIECFPASCGSCGAICQTRMHFTNIPYFQQVIVMATTCDNCGYRSSELKPGGRISEKGKRITLSVQNVDDLSRDVIKSYTAGVQIPELDLELGSGTLGGLVTTVEGLIIQISENLGRVHGFTFGDSLDDSKRKRWDDFKSALSKILSVDEPWTLIIDDALSNSFISPVTESIEDDHQLLFEEYKRSWEQNEELGLNDMDTSAADVAYND
ncbi:hypothetical protein QJS10_CPB04g01917 [Acorus calamus]|uniref:Zinc finger ZPR1-type domain-containing protein n=1 Tax=Acorus calamus TaxID=4465 RepID=A0AAV9F143_ACOCL|nr:hypothetical protein QJS10_CPB04g01917 [Acorus calamus]